MFRLAQPKFANFGCAKLREKPSELRDSVSYWRLRFLSAMCGGGLMPFAKQYLPTYEPKVCHRDAVRGTNVVNAAKQCNLPVHHFVCCRGPAENDCCMSA